MGVIVSPLRTPPEILPEEIGCHSPSYSFKLIYAGEGTTVEAAVVIFTTVPLFTFAILEAFTEKLDQVPKSLLPAKTVVSVTFGVVEVVEELPVEYKVIFFIT